MPSIKCQGQDWELPKVHSEQLSRIRPAVFVSCFFAVDSNKRAPASSNNKHFLTEAYRATLEHKLGYRQGGEDMNQALQRWKDDHYWMAGHGDHGDPFSTRVDTHVQTSGTTSYIPQNRHANTNSDKEYECHFWNLDGYCKYPDNECKYAHYHTGLVKEYIDPKEQARDAKAYRSSDAGAQRQTECHFWRTGSCKFSAEDCMYAHYPINDVPERPQGTDLRENIEQPTPKHTDSDLNQFFSKYAEKGLECFYWRHTGYCKYSEEKCLYAHHPTGKVKDVPGLSRRGDRYEGRSDPKRPLGSSTLDPDKSTASRVQSDGYAMPDPPSQKLADMTLSAFFDLFCYANPAARKEQPWDTVLSSYRTYIHSNFGPDTSRHIAAALTRTKLSIPPNIMKKHLDQVLKDIPERSTANTGNKSKIQTQGPSPKRTRNLDEEHTTSTAKRLKPERDLHVDEPDIVSEFLSTLSHDERHKIQANEPPTQSRSPKLYSPSMPRVVSNSRTNHSESTRIETPNFGMKNDTSMTALESCAPETTLQNATQENPTFSQHISITASVPSFACDAAPSASHPSPHYSLSPGEVRENSYEGQVSSSPYIRPHVQTTSSPTEKHRLALGTNMAKDLVERNKQEISNSTSNGHHNPCLPVGNGTKGTMPTIIANESDGPQKGHIIMPEPSAGRMSNGTYTFVPHQNITTTPIPVQKSYMYSEQTQEPIDAHIVRLEALLRGALLELETLKRATN